MSNIRAMEALERYRAEQERVRAQRLEEAHARVRHHRAIHPLPQSALELSDPPFSRREHENAGLAYLRELGASPGGFERIKGSFDRAKQRLP